MSSSRGWFRPLFAVVCITLTALGLRNTYADNTEEKGLAQQVACGTSPQCSTNLLSESRSALGQSFAFQVMDKPGGAAKSSEVVNVECKRGMVFLGDYTCLRK